MVYDFGLMKQNIKDLIDAFDHAVTIWSEDSIEYIADMKKHSDRWIELPVSPSAEQFSRVIFILIDALMKLTTTINGEKEVKLHSIIVHETATGYAQGFREDAYSEIMGKIELKDIVFSKDIINSWNDRELFEKIKAKKAFINEVSV
jgi:6-pyruvoyltetrahydropterin/6-carboxytetrahydropterin synthase